MARNKDWNSDIIREFRANEGIVGGQFEGRALALVHHIGRRSGQERINPLSCLPVGNAFAVFGSAAGRDRHPDWYHNLVALPDATIEFGTMTIPVRARELTGEERRQVWEKQKQVSPEFCDYEARTNRLIPVMLLERR
jgi:deazaflavin-dependent oxidoreductase (nitroreductase family)